MLMLLVILPAVPQNTIAGDVFSQVYVLHLRVGRSVASQPWSDSTATC